MSKKLITLESGEGSDRRRILEGLILYLLGVKGVKCACLSINPKVTKAYLALLPARLKETVFSKGSFQIYLRTSQIVQVMHESLFLNPANNKIIFHLYSKILFPLQDAVIQDLQAQGICVILDRSRLSSYAYFACLPAFENQSLDETLIQAKAFIEQFTPNTTSHIFVDSSRRQSYSIRNAQKYDLIAPQLNLKLKGWFNSLNNRLSEDQKIPILPPEINVESAIELVKKQIL
jgi:hypothetical protein